MNRVFYIVERDPVVQLDLVGAIKSLFGGSQVKTVPSLDNVPETADLAAATWFINPSLVTPANAALLTDWCIEGASVVFLGQPGFQINTAQVLDTPFTNSMIADLVSGAGPDQPASRPEDHT